MRIEDEFADDKPVGRELI